MKQTPIGRDEYEDDDRDDDEDDDEDNDDDDDEDNNDDEADTASDCSCWTAIWVERSVIKTGKKIIKTIIPGYGISYNKREIWLKCSPLPLSSSVNKLD